MIKLYVNGLLIEGLDESIKLTKATNDMGDLPSRQGEYSNSIKVPLTKGNCAALGFNNLQNVSTNFQFTKSVYELYETEVLISYGTARVINVKDEIELVLLSDNSDWTGTVSDKSLKDLDMTALDFSYIASEVASRRLNTTGFCFPNVWYGQHLDNAKPFDAPDFLPSAFVSFLVNKIFTEAGYTIENKITAQAKILYDKIVTIHGKKTWMQNLKNYAFYAELFKDNNILPNTTGNWFGGNYVTKNGSNVSVLKGFPIVSKDWEVRTPPFGPASGGISLSIDPKYYRSFYGFVELEVAGFFMAGDIEIWCYFGGSNPPLKIASKTITANGVYRIEFNTEKVPPMVSDALAPYILYDSLGGYPKKCIDGAIWITDKRAGSAKQLYSTTWEYLTDLAGALPAVKQSDLLKTVFNQFCILCSTNTVTKKVTFTQLDTLLENIHDAEDWSEKVDLTENIEIQYDFFDKYYQLNSFKYKDDESDPRIAFTDIGRGEITYPNQNLQAEGIIFESVFSAIERSYEWNGAVQTIELAQCENRTNGDLNWKLGVSEITEQNKITQFGQPAPTHSNEIFFNNMDFASLIQNNYNVLRNIFTNSKAIKLLMRLTRSEYERIDFSRPVFLDITTVESGHVRGHFYINLIDQYEVGENSSCFVTLVQID